jgi:hypothetical protein
MQWHRTKNRERKQPEMYDMTQKKKIEHVRAVDIGQGKYLVAKNLVDAHTPKLSRGRAVVVRVRLRVDRIPTSTGTNSRLAAT